MNNTFTNPKLAALTKVRELREKLGEISCDSVVSSLQIELMNLGINLSNHIESLRSASPLASRLSVLSDIEIEVLTFQKK